MSLNLFHAKLKKIEDLIGEGKFPEAMAKIDDHIGGMAQDSEFEEKQFMQLLVVVEYYQNAMKNSVKHLEKEDSEKALEQIKKARENGKKIVEFCENIIAVLKKEELEGI